MDAMQLGQLLSLVALAIGAVTAGWAMVQASATVASAAPVSAATSSSAASTARPLPLSRYSTLRRPRDAFAEIVLRAIFAGQEAVGEAVEGEDAEAVASDDVAQRAFKLVALDQIVPGLERRPAASNPPSCGDCKRFLDPRRRRNC